MKSVMTSSQHFSQVPEAEIQRSSFNRDHGYKTTFNEGFLVPVYVDEVLPGDTFNLKMTAFARLLDPLKFPIMDNMFLNSFFFFVPTRLVWENWQRFNGEQDYPTDWYAASATIPIVQPPQGGWVPGSLADYFGLPIWPANGDCIGNVNALPFRSVNLIWNTWFRDENLCDPLTVSKTDAMDPASIYTTYGSTGTDLLPRRGKRHDYFTSCLPWPQKAQNPVSIPLGTSAPVIPTGTGAFPTLGNTNESLEFKSSTGSAIVEFQSNATATTTPLVWVTSGLKADLASATATTINSLRTAFQIQKLYERDARGGTRYTEIIRSHFGVVSPDARLQRPEYLGGGQTTINVHPVTQMSQTDTTPQGHQAGFGTAAITNHGFTKSFTEHGYIIGFISVRADLTYQQGKNRMWTRKTRFDFYWPALAHLGEQAVLNQEIFADGTANDLLPFGYQERWAEYRYKPSQITGQFRSTYGSGTLDPWHLSQEFGSCPALNDEFIEDNPPVTRVVAVQDQPHFILDAYFDLKCARPMPVYSVPGLIDHF